MADNPNHNHNHNHFVKEILLPITLAAGIFGGCIVLAFWLQKSTVITNASPFSAIIQDSSLTFDQKRVLIESIAKGVSVAGIIKN